MKYRVNFGQGQVSHTLKTQREAQNYITSCQRDGGDPYTKFYFVEFWDPDGGWFPTARQKREAR